LEIIPKHGKGSLGEGSTLPIHGKGSLGEGSTLPIHGKGIVDHQNPPKMAKILSKRHDSIFQMMGFFLQMT
jgi:hypothetical protein